MQFAVEPGGGVCGEIRVDSDKSISHRAILLAALAEGESEIINPLMGGDVQSTAVAVAACGAQVKMNQRGGGGDVLLIRGGELRNPSADINCGNAGTLMRLFCGVAAGQNLQCRLIGDDSLSRRPMRRVADPLNKMGADIRTSADGAAPIAIYPSQKLRGISHDLTIASAQIKSAILLAALFVDGGTVIREPLPSRDHTERMLSAFGASVKENNNGGGGGHIVKISGGANLRATQIRIPADISSAAFFIVAASIAEKSELLLSDVGINPTRAGVIEILRRMGGDIEIINRREWGGEAVADLRVRSAKLKGIEIGGDLVPSAIDEFPAIFIAAANAEGKTVLTGARELRVKESDRIAAMADGLAALGISAEPLEDGIIINGGKIKGGRVESHGDHRIAMAFAIAGITAADSVVVGGCESVSTSFPRFAELAKRAGIKISVGE